MTIRELIRDLEQYPEDFEVVAVSSDTACPVVEHVLTTDRWDNETLVLRIGRKDKNAL